MGQKTLKPFYFLLIFFAVFIGGCSFVPIQKAGNEALAEAICLFDKKIDQESAKFTKCLADQTR